MSDLSAYRKCPHHINKEIHNVSLLVDAIKASDLVGAPFTHGTIAQPPKLKFKPPIQGLSSEFPTEWTEADYAKIKPLLVQAPYGKGTETVIDKSVRNALEIGSDKVELDPDWTRTQLSKAVAQATGVLVPGMDGRGVTCEFYKLVVYEEGGHFAPHRDTQRNEWHFGSLVIVLPSGTSKASSKGGELVLKHGSLEHALVVPGGKKKCAYAAYFADVQHEVKPVTKGRRISLLFHLVRAKFVNPPKVPTAVGGSTTTTTSTSTSISSSSSSSSNQSEAALPPLVKQIRTLGEAVQNFLEEGDEDEDETEEKPAKKRKTKKEDEEEKRKKEEERKTKDYDQVKKNKPLPRFLGYVCEHSYAGELRGDKLKGKDAAIWGVISPHIPGARIAHIDVSLLSLIFLTYHFYLFHLFTLSSRNSPLSFDTTNLLISD